MWLFFYIKLSKIFSTKKNKYFSGLSGNPVIFLERLRNTGPFIFCCLQKIIKNFANLAYLFLLQIPFDIKKNCWKSSFFEIFWFFRPIQPIGASSLWKHICIQKWRPLSIPVQEWPSPKNRQTVDSDVFFVFRWPTNRPCIAWEIYWYRPLLFWTSKSNLKKAKQLLSFIIYSFMLEYKKNRHNKHVTSVQSPHSIELLTWTRAEKSFDVPFSRTHNSKRRRKITLPFYFAAYLICLRDIFLQLSFNWKDFEMRYVCH
jgi:hypothetical protein